MKARPETEDVYRETLMGVQNIISLLHISYSLPCTLEGQTQAAVQHSRLAREVEPDSS